MQDSPLLVGSEGEVNHCHSSFACLPRLAAAATAATGVAGPSCSSSQEPSLLLQQAATSHQQQQHQDHQQQQQQQDLHPDEKQVSRQQRCDSTASTAAAAGAPAAAAPEAAAEQNERRSWRHQGFWGRLRSAPQQQQRHPQQQREAASPSSWRSFVTRSYRSFRSSSRHRPGVQTPESRDSLVASAAGRAAAATTAAGPSTIAHSEAQTDPTARGDPFPTPHDGSQQQHQTLPQPTFTAAAAAAAEREAAWGPLPTAEPRPLPQGGPRPIQQRCQQQQQQQQQQMLLLQQPAADEDQHEGFNQRQLAQLHESLLLRFAAQRRAAVLPLAASSPCGVWKPAAAAEAAAESSSKLGGASLGSSRDFNEASHPVPSWGPPGEGPPVANRVIKGAPRGTSFPKDRGPPGAPSRSPDMLLSWYGMCPECAAFHRQF